MGRQGNYDGIYDGILSFLYTVQSKQALIYSLNVIDLDLERLLYSDREAMFTAGTR